MKDCEIKFLNSIYRNVMMGVQSIEELLPIVESQSLKVELSDELATYNVLAKECEMISKSDGIEPRDNNWFDKTKLWSGIKMKTAFDKSTQNIAEMLLIGCQMGIIDLIKEKSKCKDAINEIQEIASKLEDFQEKSIQKLKPFLMEQ